MLHLPPATDDDGSPRLLDAQQSAELAADLSTWTTVDRRDVHKSSVAQVLVTDLVPVRSGVSMAAAQWPRTHPTFASDAAGRPHPLMFVETLRQAAICAAHREHGVPRDQHFVFQEIEARWSADQPPIPADRPATVVLAVGTSPRQVGRRTTGAAVESEAWVGGIRIASARAAYRCLSSPAYARLRAASRAYAREAVTAAHPPVDRGPGVHVSRLHVDLRDPTFFDHPQDHLPGMLLISEMLDAGSARVQQPVTTGLAGLHVAFGRFAELGVPTALVSQAPEETPLGTRVRVAVEQVGAVVAESDLTFRKPP